MRPTAEFGLAVGASATRSGGYALVQTGVRRNAEADELAMDLFPSRHRDGACAVRPAEPVAFFAIHLRVVEDPADRGRTAHRRVHQYRQEYRAHPQGTILHPLR